MTNNFFDIDNSLITEKIIEFIRQNVIEKDKEGIIVGLSGGLDSAVVLKLCTMALGSKNVCAVILPERDSDKTNIKDALRFAKELNVRIIKKKITPIILFLGSYKFFPSAFLFRKNTIRRYINHKIKKLSRIIDKDLYIALQEGSNNRDLKNMIAFYRIKNRLRSALLYYYSELNNYLLAGCINKSEYLTGFFVKYGDNIADIMPIVSLYKTQIFKLAKTINIPEYLIDKKPSSDLIPTLTDEDILNISYKKLDLILYAIEKGMSFDDIISTFNIREEEIEKVFEIMNKSEILRSNPLFFNFKESSYHYNY